LHRSIFVSIRIIIPIMVNRIFLAVLFVSSLCLVDSCRALDQRNAIPLSHMPANVKLSNVKHLNPSDKTCGGLWSKVGTVCDIQKLKVFQQTEQVNVNETKSRLIAKENTLHNLAKILISHPIMKTDMLHQNDKDLIKARASVENHKSFQGNMIQCWAYMKQMRAAGLCSVCAGDNYNYFFGVKAIITDSECQKMNKNCNAHFNHWLNLIRSNFSILKANKIRQFNNLLKDLQDKQTAKVILNKKLSEFMSQHENNRLNTFQMLKVAEDLLVDSQNQHQRCARMFRVTATPSIFMLDRIMKAGLHSIEEINNEMEKTSNWVDTVLGRALGSETDSNLALTEGEIKKTFTGDTVFMRRSDNTDSTSAYDGATGTTLGKLNPDVKPVSFSSSFP
jgi:hypothetical protein